MQAVPCLSLRHQTVGLQRSKMPAFKYAPKLKNKNSKPPQKKTQKTQPKPTKQAPKDILPAD